MPNPDWGSIDAIYLGQTRVDKIYIGDEKVWPVLKNYITFSSPTAFDLSVYDSTKHWDGALYYSTDRETWNEWLGTSAISAVSDGTKYKLYLRGSNNTVITGNSQDYKWVLSGSNVSISGDVKYLLDYEYPENAIMGGYCFSNWFYGCTSLISMPDLTFTTLSLYCYMYAFRECSNLVDPCELPSMTMVEGCYYGLFEKCSKLTSCPELPSTTMAKYCYRAMFNDCVAIISGPVLPATTLAEGCYRYMLAGCKNMTDIPGIIATDIVTDSCTNMFNGSTKVKISSTQTGEYQTLWRIPMSGTGTLASGATNNMLNNTGGTFKSAPAINTDYYTSNTVLLPSVA